MLWLFIGNKGNFRRPEENRDEHTWNWLTMVSQFQAFPLFPMNNQSMETKENYSRSNEFNLKTTSPQEKILPSLSVEYWQMKHAWRRFVCIVTYYVGSVLCNLYGRAFACKAHQIFQCSFSFWSFDQHFIFILLLFFWANIPQQNFPFLLTYLLLTSTLHALVSEAPDPPPPPTLGMIGELYWGTFHFLFSQLAYLLV